ncbi:hypothetical protein TPA0907_60940 [Micromonospora humidisoli]|nr:hypothetical protein TPA0907_60940 [Micromonospora sp. AKA109]
MPVRALDQHLKGICRASAPPHTALPVRGRPGTAAVHRRPVTVVTRCGEAR